MGNISYYIPSLLRLRELNLKETVTFDQHITIGEFFDNITGFLTLAEESVNMLREMSGKVHGGSSPGDKEQLRVIKAAVESIGSRDLSVGVGKILDSTTSSAFISEYADLLEKFCARLRKTKNVPRSLIGGEDAYDFDYNASANRTLASAVSHFESIEVTRKLQVLAVDDTAFMLKIVSLMLSDAYKVYTLTKPAMVEMFLDFIVPELFLLDYKMPEMSGFDLVPMIRAREEHKDTPIIFMTAMGTLENLTAAFNLGACDFVIKPFDNNDVLKQKVDKHITRKITF